MGSVFLALDVRLDREVAVKLLNPELLTDPTARKRMEREARALARLRDPNVIDIHDVLDHGKTLALVIEYVEGGTLADRIQGGPIPWRDALRLVDGILGGLEAIHEASLVHRDLKPDNILIEGKRGTPRITDLGVAHDAAGRGMTRQGARLGTPEYMSPEQIRGATVDPRTDLYATGIVLYEMLVGEAPFRGDSEYDIWDGHIREVPDLGRLPEGCPRTVHALVATALEKDAEDRYPTAEAMRQAAAAALEGTAAEAPSPAPDPASTSAPEAEGPPEEDGAHREAMAFEAREEVRRQAQAEPEVLEAAAARIAAEIAPKERAVSLPSPESAPSPSPEAEGPPGAAAVSAAQRGTAFRTARLDRAAQVEAARKPTAAQRGPKEAPPSSGEPAYAFSKVDVEFAFVITIIFVVVLSLLWAGAR
jgi:serine/threonine-protein kinase